MHSAAAASSPSPSSAAASPHPNHPPPAPAALQSAGKLPAAAIASLAACGERMSSGAIRQWKSRGTTSRFISAGGGMWLKAMPIVSATLSVAWCHESCPPRPDSEWHSEIERRTSAQEQQHEHEQQPEQEQEQQEQQEQEQHGQVKVKSKSKSNLTKFD